MVSETDGLERRWVVGALLAERGELLAVSGPGAATYDVAAQGDHERNFYLWNALGSAPMVGLGLALAQPAQPVLVILGDGDLLMGMGGLATIAVHQPANLSIAVLDNEHYGETGMQRSHTSFDVDLSAIARDCGIRDAATVTTAEEIPGFASKIHQMEGPLVRAIKVRSEDLPRVLPPRDGVLIGNRFREAVTGETP
jgi:thiamine pyrophosphate-dependent acetolactate synthase large subunit-like protein